METRFEPLASRAVFVQRLIRSGAAGLGLIAVSLAIGMAGYHGYEGRCWLDAFLDASMILSGMGPVGDLRTVGGKVFAGLYALYSGLAVLVIAGVVFGPIFHRFLHRFHIEAEDE